MALNHSTQPGRTWLDTSGNRMRAHGGSLQDEGGRFSR